jgi:hypothetical protein
MAAKLILTLDGAILREYSLDKDSISIGRKHGNDIQINDKTISGRHAMILINGGEVFVEDLGSTNGTMVNGSHVTKFLLMHGDIIQIGTHHLTYFNEEKAEYEPTMFIKSEIAETQVIPSQAGGSNIKGVPLGGAKLLNGPSANTVLEMRKPFNTIGFKGMTMAMISRTTHGYIITKLKNMKSKRASDTPMVNGVQIGTTPLQLNEHDIIEIAGFKMEFVFVH